MEQIPLIMPDSPWSPPTEYPRLKDEKILSWDLETCDPGLKTRGPGWSRGEGFVCGLGVATRDRAWYFPIRHEGGGNLDPKMTLRWANDLLKLDTTKLMFNGLYDAGWMKREGLTVNGKIMDPMGAAALVDENRWSYEFNELLKTYTNVQKDETLLRQAAKDWGVDPKGGLWKLPSQYVGIYGEADPLYNWVLMDALEPILRDEDMWELFELEMDLYPVWLDMTWRGIRIDENWVEQSRQTVKKEIKQLDKELKGLDVWSAADVGKVFEDTGIRVPKTKKTKKFSIQKDWLERVHTPLSMLILRKRRLDRVLGTYLEGMIEGHLVNGRIHPDWHPLRNDSDSGIVSGRVSASNPSPQVFPKRDPEFGALTRGAFIPEDGDTWLSADQAQQEPRWFVHYAAELELSGVDRMLQAYEDDPDTSYHEMCAKFSELEKAKVKDINLAFAYGMGEKASIAGLVLKGATLERARTVYATFHREFPYVQQMTDHVSDIASQRGWVRTILNRRRHFEMWEPENNFGEDRVTPMTKDRALLARKNNDPEWKGKRIQRAFVYKATNSVIQGTSADQIKKAMLDLWRAGCPPMLCQIHDELNFSNGQGKKGVELVRECMQDAIKARVPFRVAIDEGQRWMAPKEEE